MPLGQEMISGSATPPSKLYRFHILNMRNRSYSIAVEAEIESHNGLPLDDRTAVEVLADPTRPQVAPLRDRFQGAAGVLFSHGSAFGGHALYVKDGKLKYAYNFVGSMVQTVESSEDVPTGNVMLGASFVREGDSMPSTGTLSLFIDDRKVGEGTIRTQPGNFSLVGEGLNIGKDPASPVTDDYPGERPYAFTGGTIKQAVVDLTGEEYVDLEREALAMMKRE